MRLLEFASLIRPLRGDGPLTRDVNGVAWAANGGPQGTDPLSCRRESGFLICQGWDNSSSQYRSILFAVTDRIGTYALGGNGAFSFPLAELAMLSKSNTNPAVQMIWGSEPVGGSGTVTITTLTATGGSGTFSFIAVGRTETGATGTQVIRGGVFDITF